MVYNLPPPAMPVPQNLPVPGPVGSPQPMANPGVMGAPLSAPMMDAAPMVPQAPPTGGAGMYGMPQGQMPQQSPMGPPEAMMGAPAGGPPPGYGLPAGVKKNFSLDQPYGGNSFGVHHEVTPRDVVNHLFDAIPNVESKGQPDPYKARNPKSTASGKYQYTDSTWGNYGGYPHAALAPPEIQDRRMQEDLGHRMMQYGGDPFKATAAHLFPKYANDPLKWNQPLVDSHGKEIPGAGTVAQYVSKVLGPQRVQAYLANYQ